MPYTYSFRASLALAITFLSLLASSQNDTNSTSPSLMPTSMPTQIYTSFSPTSDPITPITSTNPTSSPTQTPSNNITTTSIIITTGFPTSEPTTEPTLEPTISPTQTSSPTSAPTDPTYTEVEIVITIAFTSTNATEDELTELILLAIDELIASLNLTVLDYDADDFTIEIIDTDSETSENVRRLIAPSAATYTFRITLSVLDENDIDSPSALIESIKSPEFASALIADIEESTFSEIAEDGLTISASAVDSDSDSSDGVDWLDWRTWEVLNWLMVGGALLVLCVLSLCLARCCCLVLCCKESRERRKSDYQMRQGGAMFDRVDSHNTAGKEKQFQTDLRTAIEMNKRGTLLKGQTKGGKNGKGGKKVEEEVESLDADAVGAAFDMNFDEKTPIINGGRNGGAGSAVAKATMSVDEDGAGITGDPLMRGATPGGPEEEEEENVPPAPVAPQSVEEEHAEAYDLL